MKQVLRSLPAALLILLYSYAALSKLADFAESRGQMLNQPLPRGLAEILVLAVPLAELACAGLLLFRRTVRAGLYLSLFLLLVFTGYIGLVLLHYWDRVPCSCGGVLARLSWPAHLAFNCIFIILNLIAIKTQGDAENLEQSRPNLH